MVAARVKQVTVSFNKTPLRHVCAKLTRESGITVSSQITFLEKPVILDVKGETRDKVLGAIATDVRATVQSRDGGLRFRAAA